MSRDEVTAALASLVDAGIARIDREHTLLLMRLPDRCSAPTNPSHLRFFYRAWSELPSCDLKTAYLSTMAWLMEDDLVAGAESLREEWDATFGAELGAPPLAGSGPWDEEVVQLPRAAPAPASAADEPPPIESDLSLELELVADQADLWHPGDELAERRARDSAPAAEVSLEAEAVPAEREVEAAEAVIEQLGAGLGDAARHAWAAFDAREARPQKEGVHVPMDAPDVGSAARRSLTPPSVPESPAASTFSTAAASVSGETLPSLHVRQAVDRVSPACSQAHSMSFSDFRSGQPTYPPGLSSAKLPPACARSIPRARSGTQPPLCSVGELLQTLAVASKGRVLVAPYDPRMSSPIAATIRAATKAGVTMEDIRLVGVWLAEGGLAYRGDLGPSWVAQTGALLQAVASARQWVLRGCGAVGPARGAPAQLPVPAAPARRPGRASVAATWQRVVELRAQGV